MAPLIPLAAALATAAWLWYWARVDKSPRLRRAMMAFGVVGCLVVLTLVVRYPAYMAARRDHERMQREQSTALPTASSRRAPGPAAPSTVR